MARRWFWVWLVALSVFFVLSAGYNLSNYRPINDDDATIMSVSHKLATEGLFGSDLYAGFLDADRCYYGHLPVYSILQAITFKLAGTGVAQARCVSVTGAVVLLWVVSGLAHRWYGPCVGALTALLLVFWRFELTGASTGLPMLGLARAGRYDIVAIAWVWIAIALLDQLLRRPGRPLGLALGTCCGVAALTQFFGWFVGPLVAVAWFWLRGRRALRDPISYWIAAGFTVVVLPYIIDVSLNFAAFQTQHTVMKSDRIDFLRPSFFLDNLRNEPNRLRTLLERPLPLVSAPYTLGHPFSPWLLILGFVPAIAALWWRFRHTPELWGNRLLALSLVIFGGLLALIDSTKAPVYAVSLAPSVCVLMAAAVGLVAQRSKQHPWLLVPTLGLLVLVTAEGIGTHWVDRRAAAAAGDYLAVGRRMNASLTRGAGVLGADRWWWALPDHPYFSLNALFLRWQWMARQDHQPAELSRFIDETRADYVIVNNDVRGQIARYPDRLQRQFRDFLRQRTRLVAEWNDPTYERIEIHRLERASEDRG